MKKLKNILAVVLLAAATFSCNDVLDKGPLDSYSENDVWKSTDLTQAFLYTTLRISTDKLIQNDRWTDNDIILDDGEATAINKDLKDRYYDAGWNVYENIRRCNLVIAKMADAPFTEGERANFIAQAKFFRAMTYFSRARFFGKLMLVKELVDKDEDMTQYGRTATIKDTYDFILQDLKDAASGLRASEPTGMPTKGAAYALLAEAALHGAAYIESGQSEYYEIARQASEDLFALNVYSLDTDYKNMFNDFDHSQNSKEIILAQWKSSDNTIFQNTWMQDLVPNNDNNKNKEGSLPLLVEELAGWPKSFPSVDLVNQYLVVDEDGKAKEWDETSYYQNFLAKGGYVSNAIYKNRDNRFYASIAQDSSNYFKNTITMRKKGNLNWASKAAEIWGTPISGYVYRKGVYEAVRLLNSEPTSYHYVLLRLGRSYLNYAEVMLRQNKVNAAIEYINKTRTVHGGLPELPSGLSAEEAWKEYKKVYFQGKEELADGFTDNPLANSAHYQVYLNDVSMQDSLVTYIKGLTGVREVKESAKVANTLTDFNKLLGYVSGGIILILLCVAVFLISNTVTVGISVSKEEIAIMKLIGATDFLVRAPFIVEGIVIGLIGAAIPLGVLYFMYQKIIVYIAAKFNFIGSMIVFEPVKVVFRTLIPVGVILGAGIGFIGSQMTIRKHLKV